MKISSHIRSLASLVVLALVVTFTLSAQSVGSRGNVPKAPPAPQTAGKGHIQTMAVPELRVVTKVDDSKRATLFGHVSSALRAAKDMGRLDPSTPAEHMVMVLKSSGAQERELRRVLDEQQDKKTANYHQWITPEDFGAHFGVHDADIARITDWLHSHGLAVDDVAKGKRLIHFSGTTGQLEEAFHTEMHVYNLRGETHAANATEISVPKALEPVIGGVSMHNFFRKSRMAHPTTLKQLAARPNYTSDPATHFVTPGDFSVIYNTAPLLGAGINGAGSSIAVVGRSDILMSDVQTYRTMFGLPENDPIFIHAGPDNGIVPGDDGESDLDVEISGGNAPQAKVYFVIGAPTFLVDGITNSIQYIVENNVADIMSISYGSCEAVEGAGGNAFNNSMFEQAAAQGISVFVAAGDNGPAGCDNQNTQTYEYYGYAVGGEASTPYGVAVGGTTLYGDDASPSTYWSLTNSSELSSALTYIPEYPWNESNAANFITSDDVGSNLWSGSGGISAYYLQPSWQTGSGIGNSSDPTPAGANGSYITSVTITNPGSGYTTAPTATFSLVAGTTCTTAPPASTTTITTGSVTAINFSTAPPFGFNCTRTGGGTPQATVAFTAAPAGGITATATVTMGPMQYPNPLIGGVPHRTVPDLSLDASSGHDATMYCAEGVCQLDSTGGLLNAGLVGGTSVAAPSMAGIQALINQANGGRQGNPNYIYYSLSNAQSEAGCNSSTPPLVGNTCAFQDITVGDNLICAVSDTSCQSSTTGAYNSAKIGWSAGTGYDLATGLGSVDAYNLSTQWGSVVFNSSNTTLDLSKTSGIAQGQSVTLSGSVAPGSGSGTPTGDVAFILSQGALGQVVNVTTGNLNGPTNGFTKLSGGNYSATINNLPAGTYTLTARYGGDQTFASSLSAPVTVTVGNGTPTVTITPGVIKGTPCTLTTTKSIAYGATGYIKIGVASSTGAGVPTGTVTVNVDGVPYATSVQLDSQGNAYLTEGQIPAASCVYDLIEVQNGALNAGAHTISATYSGDSTFSAASATPATLTVTKLTSTPTLTAGKTRITAGDSDQLTATFATIAALTGSYSGLAAPTGTVTFTDTTTSTVLGTASVTDSVAFSGNIYTYSGAAPLTTTGITTTGAHSITAAYSGDTNFAATTSTAVTVTVGTGTATTTAVTSNGNPTILNGRPTFTATITGGPTSGTVTFYDGTAVLGTGTVNSAHKATYRPAVGAPFWGGAHSITAAFGGVAGATNYTASTSPVFTETVTQGTVLLNLTAKTYGTRGNAFTFAALLTPSESNATFAPNQSVVTFYDGGTAIGSAKPITITAAQGGLELWTSTLTVSNLAVGSHTITAQYSDINYSPAISNAQTVVVGNASGVTWSAPAAITYGTALSATQLNATSSGVAGTYQYYPALGTVLTAGTHTLSVVFTPSNTTNNTPQTATVPIVVNPAPLTVTVDNKNSTYGGAIPTLTGVVGGTVNGDTVGGTLSVTYSTTATSSSVVGSYPITAVVAGAAGRNYAATIVPGHLTIGQALLTVTVNPASFTYGGTLPAFTGTVSGLVNGDTLGGNVTVSYGTTVAATANAGIYAGAITATLTGSSLGNYSVINTPGTLTINQAALTVTVNPASFTYGGALPAFTGTVSGLVNGDTLGGKVTVSYGTTVAATANAGIYTGAITATLGGSSFANYSVASTPATLTINQAALTVTVNPGSFTYGGTLPTFTGTVSGLVNGDTSNAIGVSRPAVTRRNGASNDITVSYSLDSAIASATSNAGSYAGAITASVTGTAAPNYTVSVTPGDLTIGQAALTVTVNPASFTYGGTLPTFTGTVSGLVNGDTSNAKGATRPAVTRRNGLTNDITVSYSLDPAIASATSNAGLYAGGITASVGGTALPNYTVSVIPGDLTIGQAALTVTVNPASFTYGGSLPAFTGTVSGLVNGDTSNARGGTRPAVTRRNSPTNDITVSYSLDPSIASATSNAGAYAGAITASVTGSAASNYTVSVTPGDLTIAQAALTVTVNPASFTYGGTLPSFTGTVSGLVNGDTLGGNVNVSYGTTVSASANAGAYIGAITANLSGGSLSNYSVVNTPATLTIGQAALTVTVNPAGFTYGGALPTFTSTVTGLVNGDTSNAIGGTRPAVTRRNSPANDITISYSLDPAIASATSNAGFYAGGIDASVTGTAAPNYTVSVTPGDLTIGQAALTVTVNPGSFTYGGTLPAFTGTVSGLVNGDTSNAIGGSRPAVARRNSPTNDIAVSYSLDPAVASATSNAGAYAAAITASVSGTAAPNYTVSVTPGILTIGQAALSVTVNPASFTYGGTLPAFTGTVSGLVNGDTLGGNVTASYGTTVAVTANAGIYSGAITATLSGGSLSNYSVTSTPGTLTIGQAALTVTVNPASFTYGGALPAFSGTVSGLVNGDTSNARGIIRPIVRSRNNLTNDITVNYSLDPAIASATSNAGTYSGAITASVTGTAAPNYTVSVIAGNLTIGQATLTVIAADKSVTFGFPLPVFTYSITGFVNGDNPTSGAASGAPSLTTIAVQGSAAGNYPINATIGGLTAANYTFVLDNGTLTINPGPAVSFSQTSLAFGNQLINTTSATKSVTLTNAGSATLNFGGGLTGPNASSFSKWSTCTGPLAPGASCTIYVTFKPTATGAATASLTLTDNAYGSPHLVQFSGTGTAPVVTLSQTSLSFGNQSINTSSAAQQVTLTNSGTGTLTFSGVLTGPNASSFSKWSNCTGPLAPGAFCTIYVSFTPTATIAETAALTITDNASGSPHSVQLSGTGTAPAVTLSQTSLSFGNQLANTSSAAQPVTLTNSGSATLTFSALFTGFNSSSFSQSSNCTGNLAPGGACTFNVVFKPTVAGLATAVLTITDNASGSPHSVQLSGTGTAPVVTLSQASLIFSNQTVNTSSAAQPVTLTNSGTGALTFSLALTGSNATSFSQSSNCTGTLAVGGSCTINVVFKPTATGAATAALTITDNASGSPQPVQLSGTGTAPVVTLSQTSLTFGNQKVNTTSAAQQVTLSNTGTGTLNFSGALTGPNASSFSKWSNCTGPLAPGASCTVNIAFKPTATGAATAALTITDNATGSPHSVALSGTGN